MEGCLRMRRLVGHEHLSAAVCVGVRGDRMSVLSRWVRGARSATFDMRPHIE